MTTTVPLDRETVYTVLWPELADEIHLCALTSGGSYDRVSDAEGDTIDWLLDSITGNACTGREVIDMALDLMGAAPEPDSTDEIGRLVDDAYAVLATVPDVFRAELVARLILDSDAPAQVLTEITDHVDQGLHPENWDDLIANGERC